MKFNFVDVPNLNFEIERIDNEGNRLYKVPSGALYPSVTSVLSHLNKKGIVKWRNRVGHEEANRISSKASIKGTKIHKLCEDYILGNQDGEKLNPLYKHLFLQLKRKIDENVNNIHCVEAKLYSDRLKLAGTVDMIAEYANELSVIDFKTSSKLKKEDYILNYFFQATIYSLMFEELTGLKAKQIVIMIAVENEEPQIFIKKRKDYIERLINYLKTISR